MDRIVLGRIPKGEYIFWSFRGAILKAELYKGLVYA